MVAGAFAAVAARFLRNRVRMVAGVFGAVVARFLRNRVTHGGGCVWGETRGAVAARQGLGVVRSTRASGGGFGPTARSPGSRGGLLWAGVFGAVVARFLRNRVTHGGGCVWGETRGAVAARQGLGVVRKHSGFRRRLRPNGPQSRLAPGGFYGAGVFEAVVARFLRNRVTHGGGCVWGRRSPVSPKPGHAWWRVCGARPEALWLPGKGLGL